MKRFLYSTLLLVVSLAAFAQTSAELDAYLREFPQRAGFNTHSYEFLPIKDTPAPGGFKPFYISHYGRHGSRSHGSDASLKKLVSYLQVAADEGILTPSGDTLFYYAKKVLELHDGMDGRLTPRGAREHEMLARRMYQRYPGVFRNGEVHALSSVVPRCLVSMAAFTSSLQSCKTDLVITWDAGETIQKIISHGAPTAVKEKAGAIVHGPMTAVKYDTMYVYSRVFTDPERGKAIFKKPGRLASYIYNLARITEAFDIDENLFRFLPWEAVLSNFNRGAFSAYLQQCNSVPFGDERLPRASRLADEMVRKADAAIAGAPVAADLIFGHDWPFLGICSYFGLEGYGYPRLTPEQAYGNWNGAKLCPYAANLQLIFYRNRKGLVLVKFLANEQETLIPELEAYSGPYYKWVDVKNYIAKRKTTNTMTKKEKTTKPKGFVLEHPAIDVADPVATAKWWCENLGFTKTYERDDETHTTFIVDASGRVAIELYRAKTQPQAPDYANMDPLTLHFGFTSTDVDADIERLVKAGATLVTHDKNPGFDGAMMRDPSGIPIQFVKREKSILLK